MTVLADMGASRETQKVFVNRAGELIKVDRCGKRVGAGGEAEVLRIVGKPGLVAKLYLPGKFPETKAGRDARRRQKLKLETMAEAVPFTLAPGAHPPAAWPVDVLYHDRARLSLAGFVMPQVKGARDLVGAASGLDEFARFGVRSRHAAACNVARVFASLHGAGYIVGDVNDQNVLIRPDGAVTVIDTDSFAFDPATVRANTGARTSTSSRGGMIFESHLMRPEYQPQERLTGAVKAAEIGPEQDVFGLAVLIFQLLVREHPFAGRLRAGDDEIGDLAGRIKAGVPFPWSKKASRVRRPAGALALSAFDPRVQRLFLRAFVDGLSNPAKRPTAAEWADVMAATIKDLKPCTENALHARPQNAWGCPYCAHERRQASAKAKRPVPKKPSAKMAAASAQRKTTAAGRASALPSGQRKAKGAGTKAAPSVLTGLPRGLSPPAAPLFPAPPPRPRSGAAMATAQRAGVAAQDAGDLFGSVFKVIGMAVLALLYLVIFALKMLPAIISLAMLGFIYTTMAPFF